MNNAATSFTVMSMAQESAARSDAAAWTLPRGEARRLSIGPGARLLRVAEGQVWLTTAGKGGEAAEDQWLTSGEQVRMADGSEVVLEARGEARFQLLVPPDACASHAAVWEPLIERAASSLSHLTAALSMAHIPSKGDTRYSVL